MMVGVKRLFAPFFTPKWPGKRSGSACRCPRIITDVVKSAWRGLLLQGSNPGPSGQSARWYVRYSAAPTAVLKKKMYLGKLVIRNLQFLLNAKFDITQSFIFVNYEKERLSKIISQVKKPDCSEPACLADDLQPGPISISKNSFSSALLSIQIVFPLVVSKGDWDGRYDSVFLPISRTAGIEQVYQVLLPPPPTSHI
ncbi:hypothetical protein LXL04_032794 [Taraxacum kok-saghyz]